MKDLAATTVEEMPAVASPKDIRYLCITMNITQAEAAAYPAETAEKLRRFSFLCGYAARNAHEEVEVYTLQVWLLEHDIDTGWAVVKRDRSWER